MIEINYFAENAGAVSAVVRFMDKRTSALQETQELTFHPAGFDSPIPTDCRLLIINHASAQAHD